MALPLPAIMFSRPSLRSALALLLALVALTVAVLFWPRHGHAPLSSAAAPSQESAPALPTLPSRASEDPTGLPIQVAGAPAPVRASALPKASAQFHAWAQTYLNTPAEQRPALVAYG